MVTITMMTTMTKRRTTWLIAEDPEICLLVVRSPVLLFKTLVETPQTPRTSSRTFSQRRRRTFCTSLLRGLFNLLNYEREADSKHAETRSVPPARKMPPAHPSRPTSEAPAPRWAVRAPILEPFPTLQARVLLPAAARSFPW